MPGKYGDILIARFFFMFENVMLTFNLTFTD